SQGERAKGPKPGISRKAIQNSSCYRSFHDVPCFSEFSQLAVEITESCLPAFHSWKGRDHSDHSRFELFQIPYINTQHRTLEREAVKRVPVINCHPRPKKPLCEFPCSRILTPH